MGRLFWKFFIILSFAQLTTVIGVSATFWLKHRQQQTSQTSPVDQSPPADFLVNSAAATLQFGGLKALTSLLEKAGRPAIFAVDAQNKEILGRQIDAAETERVREMLDANPDARAVRSVKLENGHEFILFSPASRACPLGKPCGARKFPPDMRSRLPVEPVIGGFLASLIFAALLASYFSRPLRNLRAAFEAAGAGNLDVRLGLAMGNRRDELADLGRNFDRMAGQLGALMDGQHRLLHDVSHELRSPLARLQAAIGLARQQPEKLGASLDRIERESMRMDRLVGELLTLSRLEAGVTGAMAEIINLDELVSCVVEDARFEAEANGRTVNFFGVRGLFVKGNAELLHRSIENVVRNAIKHTPENSRVTLEVKPDGASIRILVLDQGPGIPENELTEIFKPFFRGQDGRGTDGHGLGLAIARHVIEAHGGSIFAANLEAGGLRVEIILPGYRGPGNIL